MIFLFIILSIEEDDFIPRPVPPEWRVPASEVYNIMVKEWVVLGTREPGGFGFLNFPKFVIPYSRASVEGIEAGIDMHLLLLRSGFFLSGRWDSLLSSGFFESVNPYAKFPFILNAGYLANNGLKPTGSFTVFYPSGTNLFGITGGYRNSLYGGVVLQFSRLRFTMGKDIAGIMFFDDEWFLRVRYGFLLPPVYDRWFKTPEYSFRATTSLDLFYLNTYLRIDLVEKEYRAVLKRGFLQLFYISDKRITGVKGTVERVLGRVHFYAYSSVSGKNITTTRELRGETGIFIKPEAWIIPAMGIFINTDKEWRFAIGMGME